MYDVSFIGIDNGVSGTIGALCYKDGVLTPYFQKTPTKKEQNYTKAKGNISRVGTKQLYRDLKKFNAKNVSVIVERPMVNPSRFQATASALRALEATLIVLERLKYGKQYVDSKEWQRVVLPKGIKGAPELKRASRDVGKRLYPQFAVIIDKHKDADGLMMAHFLMKANQFK